MYMHPLYRDTREVKCESMRLPHLSLVLKDAVSRLLVSSALPAPTGIVERALNLGPELFFAMQGANLTKEAPVGMTGASLLRYYPLALAMSDLASLQKIGLGRGHLYGGHGGVTTGITPVPQQRQQTW